MNKSKFITTKQPLYLRRQQHTATILKNKNVLMIGGTSDKKTSYAEIFKPEDYRTKLVRTPLNYPRSRHTSTLLKDGRVLIAGGLGRKRTLGTAEIFNPREEKITLLKSRMLVSRQQHTSTILPDGRVVFIGGWGGEGKTLDSIEIFYPTSNFYPITTLEMAVADRTDFPSDQNPSLRSSFVALPSVVLGPVPPLLVKVLNLALLLLLSVLFLVLY